MSSSTPPPPADDPNRPFRARRGSQWLSNGEFQAYLAAAIRLEHINLLLGAGCSYCLGGQTMGGVWACFENDHSNSHQWLDRERFLADAGAPNIEELLNSLAVAEAEWRRADDERMPDLRVAVADLHRAVIKGSLLNRSWWEEPESVRAAPELQDHRTMLLRLCGARQAGQDAPWLFTTNYDLGIEWTAESLGLRLVNGFTGLHVRTFAPQNFDVGFRSTATRGEAQYLTSYFYLAKLHGSLSWQQRKRPANLPAISLGARGRAGDAPRGGANEPTQRCTARSVARGDAGA